jgi:serine/threonine protein kinase
MPAPRTIDQFLDLVKKSGVLDDKRLDARLDEWSAAGILPDNPTDLADQLVRDELLSRWQADQFLLGKCRGFIIGNYKILDQLGSGGMSCVYLCEHFAMTRPVAVKVLPKTMVAGDSVLLKRFCREARATAALDHPNVVHAYDVDETDQFHFMVMEYIQGTSLEEIVEKEGPLEIHRAVDYIRQAARGLQYIHETGLVHRDIKPGNLLVEQHSNTIKILDMGLARFFNDTEDVLTRGVLGTVDYFAPEQTLDSHNVDIRADIYSLGGTFSFLLTGSPPFEGGTVLQKIVAHRKRDPKPIRSVRPDVPEGLVAVINKMMAKSLEQRYQVPNEVVEALAPWESPPVSPGSADRGSANHS